MQNKSCIRASHSLGFRFTYAEECRMLRAMRKAEQFMRRYGQPTLPPNPEDESENLNQTSKVCTQKEKITKHTEP